MESALTGEYTNAHTINSCKLKIERVRPPQLLAYNW